MMHIFKAKSDEDIKKIEEMAKNIPEDAFKNPYPKDTAEYWKCEYTNLKLLYELDSLTSQTVIKLLTIDLKYANRTAKAFCICAVVCLIATVINIIW